MGISTGGVAVAMLSVKLLLEPGEIILFFKRTSIIITQKISGNKINGWKKLIKSLYLNIADSYEPFTVVPSQGSHRNHLIRDSKGFVYSFNGKTKDGNVTWRCNKRRTECKCKSYVRTQDQFIICHFYEHNHCPQLQVFKWINTYMIKFD